MFSKTSRYRKLPDVLAVDAAGRELPSRSFRLLPEVSGQFLHTIADADRLDQLANTYYQQPQKWWRICDANPEYLSPLALLGKEPIVSARFPLSFTDTERKPRWAELLGEVATLVGVEDVWLADDETVTWHFVLSRRELGSESRLKELQSKITALHGVEHVWLADDKKSVRITYKPISTQVDALDKTIKTARFIVEQSRTVVNSIIITYNQMTIQVEMLTSKVQQVGEKAGFNNLKVGHPQAIGRTGKQIVIPPDVSG